MGNKPMHYGAYDIVGEVPIPEDGRLILGFNDNLGDRYVVSRMWPSGQTGEGHYRSTIDSALQKFMEELAGELKMVTGIRGSVVVRPGDLEIMQRNASDVANAIADWDLAEAGSDNEDAKAAKLRDTAETLAMQLQELNLIAGLYGVL